MFDELAIKRNYRKKVMQRKSMMEAKYRILGEDITGIIEEEREAGVSQRDIQNQEDCFAEEARFAERENESYSEGSEVGDDDSEGSYETDEETGEKVKKAVYIPRQKLASFKEGTEFTQNLRTRKNTLRFTKGTDPNVRHLI